LRAGTIIAFNNTYNNFGRGHELKVYRQLDYSPHWGVSNGKNPYDDNDPNGSTGYWESGSHTGPNGATTLTDSTKRWSSNQWSVPGVSYILRNVTKEAAVTSPSQILQAHIVSNSSTTINYGGSLPAPLKFDTGDKYQIWKVIHSLDQAGQGKDDGTMNGLPATPAHFSSITEPCYGWNNTFPLSTGQGSIKEGRDFFNGTPKPGYRAYTYPHPLTGPAPPTNLQIAASP